MIGGATRWLARLYVGALAVLFALMPAHALAQEPNSGLTHQAELPCHTIVDPEETMAAIARDAARWSCGALEELPAGAQQIAVRFGLGDSTIAQPGVLVNSHTYREFDTFERFAIVTVGEREIASSGWLTVEQFPPTSPVWKTRVEAPSIAGEAQAVIVRIDAPERAGVIDRFELVDTAPDALLANADQLIAATLCGLLLLPVLIGLGHFRVLRSRYAAYHFAYCVLAIVQIAALGGLLPLLFDIPRTAQFMILHLSFDLITATSVIFAVNFIEPDRLSATSRRLLYAIGALALVLGTMRVTLGQTIGDAIAFIYYGGYVLFLVGLGYALAQSLLSGSRASRFILAGFLPLVVIGTLRVVLALATNFEIRFHAVVWQHLALSWQAVVTAIAVADRFLILRQERDHARDTARLLERVSERDSLTDLYNRRIITERYAQLHADGFTSLAVLDLDHFKAINDTFGHAAGDDVLCAVADALGPDEDTIVVRMGGEEFVLLLRGDAVFERAERRRIAVGLAGRAALGDAHRVTASMGLIELSPETAPDMDFYGLYERADRLLYEAKNAGRDRTVSERLKVFRPRRRDRRSADRRHAA